MTDLYIVYDKTTKKQAKALTNKLVEKKYKCQAWDEKTYKANENKALNTNPFLFFSQSLINDNIPSEEAETHTISDGVSLVSIGRNHGINIDTSAIEDGFWGRNWWKYLITLVATGLIGAGILTIFLKTSSKKKIEFKLYFDAVKYLIKDDNIKLIIPD